MSEAKKWVKHTPSETPKAKRKLTAKAPKQEKPPIPQDTLEALKLRFSVPVSKKTDEIEESDLEMWQLVCDLKGFLTKPGNSKAPLGMHELIWLYLRKILDQAIVAGDAAVFSKFAEAWVKANIRETAPRKSVNTGKPVTAEEANLAEKIEALLPNIPANKPNSPVSIQILNIIERLQGSLKRAPTQTEIVDASSGEKDGGLTPGEVSRQTKKMGIRDSLSVS